MCVCLCVYSTTLQRCKNFSCYLKFNSVAASFRSWPFARKLATHTHTLWWLAWTISRFVLSYYASYFGSHFNKQYICNDLKTVMKDEPTVCSQYKIRKPTLVHLVRTFIPNRMNFWIRLQPLLFRFIASVSSSFAIRSHEKFVVHFISWYFIKCTSCEMWEKRSSNQRRRRDYWCRTHAPLSVQCTQWVLYTIYRLDSKSTTIFLINVAHKIRIHLFRNKVWSMFILSQKLTM